MTEKQVRRMLAKAIQDAGSERRFGREHGMSGVHAGRVARGEKLSPAILAALGVEVASTVTTYRRIRK